MTETWPYPLDGSGHIQLKEVSLIMHDRTVQGARGLLGALAIQLLTSGCTTYNPATGHEDIDYGKSAGLAGAAMGAAALGVALSNNNNNNYYGGSGYYGGYGGSAHYNRVSGNTINHTNNVTVNNPSRNRPGRGQAGSFGQGNHPARPTPGIKRGGIKAR
jgi:hypothetical protein